MILVNLLPPDLRKETAGYAPLRRAPFIAKMGGVLFIVLTVIFYAQYLMDLRGLHLLQKRWGTIQRDVKRIDKIKTEMEGAGSNGEKDFIERYVVSPYSLTRILSSLSELIPDSIWLVEMRALRQPSANTLVLKGVSRALQGQSTVQEIERYLRALRERTPPGTNLVLTTTRQGQERAELTLFTAVFKW